MSAFTSIQHFTGSSSLEIRQEKQIKGVQIEKEEVKLFLIHRWHDLIYRKSSKDPQKNLPQLINEFSKTIGYKIKTQKSILFHTLAMNNSKMKFKKTLKQLFRNKSNKKVQDEYQKRQNSLKETKEDLSKWKDLPCSWVGRFSIIKKAILHRVIYRFKAKSLWRSTVSSERKWGWRDRLLWDCERPYMLCQGVWSLYCKRGVNIAFKAEEWYCQSL